MNRYLKYILLLLVVALVGYKSVYFKKISTMKAAVNKTFDAVGFAEKLWTEKLPGRLQSAVELDTLIEAIKTNPGHAFSVYSNAIGIGNYRYCLVHTNGIVVAVNPDDISLQVKNNDSVLNINLVTEFVYGNAVRDASSLVDMKDFTSNTDLNNVSEEVNRRIRNEVLPPFKKVVKKGDQIDIVGAIELRKEHIKFNGIEIIPARLKIIR